MIRLKSISVCFLVQICKVVSLSIHGTPPFKKKLFVAFPWVETNTGPRGFMICVVFFSFFFLLFFFFFFFFKLWLFHG